MIDKLSKFETIDERGLGFLEASEPTPDVPAPCITMLQKGAIYSKSHGEIEAWRS